MDLHFSLNGPIGQLSHEFALSVNVCVCLFVPLTFGMFKSANLALWLRIWIMSRICVNLIVWLVVNITNNFPNFRISLILDA